MRSDTIFYIVVIGEHNDCFINFNIDDSITKQTTNLHFSFLTYLFTGNPVFEKKVQTLEEAFVSIQTFWITIDVTQLPSEEQKLEGKKTIFALFELFFSQEIITREMLEAIREILEISIEEMPEGSLYLH